jgi:hypothetical protein
MAVLARDRIGREIAEPFAVVKRKRAHAGERANQNGKDDGQGTP